MRELSARGGGGPAVVAAAARRARPRGSSDFLGTGACGRNEQGFGKGAKRAGGDSARRLPRGRVMLDEWPARDRGSGAEKVARYQDGRLLLRKVAAFTRSSGEGGGIRIMAELPRGVHGLGRESAHAGGLELQKAVGREGAVSWR